MFQALSLVRVKAAHIYHKHTEVGEMVAAASDNSILTNTGSATSRSPILKIKIPRSTPF